MPYIEKCVKIKNYIFGYKHYAFRYGKKVPRSANTGKTPAKQKEVNRRIQADKKRWVLLENFEKGDWWVELTYRQGERPDTIDEAFRNVQALIRKLARILKKQGVRLTYMQMTERGEYGGLHHHIIIKNNFDIGILNKLWSFGKVIIDDIYSDDLLKLADYFAKGRKATSEKKYSQSRNLIIPKPETKVISAKAWKKTPQKAGWEICDLYNGYHDETGYDYQRCVMRRIC